MTVNVGRTNRNLMSFMQHSLTTLIHSRLCPRRRDRSRACPPSPHPHPSSCPHIICRWINKNWRWIMEWEEGGRPGDPEGRDDEGKTNLDLIETRKNQNKQILLKLSFVLSSDCRPEPFQIRIVIGGKMVDKKTSTKVVCCLCLGCRFSI